MSKKIILEEPELSALIKFYLEPNSLSETAKKFNLSCKQIVKRILLDNNIELHSKEQFIKIRNEKSKQAWLNKSEEDRVAILEKSKQTCIKKYGVEFAAQAEEVKEKSKQDKEILSESEDYSWAFMILP